MKQVLFTNWNFFRLLRLAAGIGIVVQAVIDKDLLFGLGGLVFSAMAIFNTGCCASGGCYAPIRKTSSADTKDIGYEEVV